MPREFDGWRLCLDEDLIASAQKVVAQRRILSELGHISNGHKLKALLAPARLIEAAHLPADALALHRRLRG